MIMGGPTISSKVVIISVCCKFIVCEKDLLDVQKSKYDGGYGDINMATGGVGKASVSTRSKKTKGASLVNPNTKR